MNKSTINFNYERAFTHNGKFHADDVFSTALLKLINPEIEIIRGSVVPEDFDGIVYDIGGGRYDHHQSDAEVRNRGPKYASFGLLWRDLAELLIDKQGAWNIERNFVFTIDDCDNSSNRNILSSSISVMNPGVVSEEEERKCFDEAVAVAMTLLKAHIESEKRLIEETQDVIEMIDSMEDGEEVLVMPEFKQWKRAVSGTAVSFVVFPSDRGGFSVNAVFDKFKRELKYRFPRYLGGLPQKKLEEITGIDGFNFCHEGGFVSSVSSIDSAFKLIDYTKNYWAKCA